jgi:hypothetical protein
MSIISLLASSLNRKDETPNQELAKQIANKNDQIAAKELIQNLSHQNKAIQSDCIKVLYEIGELNAKLIAPYAADFVALLENKNNRLQWGAMTALNTIVSEKPAIIYAALAKIIDVADKGSVITNDHCVGILIKLIGIKAYSNEAFALLNERLLKCPTNQLPMYAENALLVISNEYKITFINTLTSRLGEIEKDSKRIRVEKVIKKLNK